MDALFYDFILNETKRIQDFVNLSNFHYVSLFFYLLVKLV